MLGSLRHCIPAANRGHRCHLRSNTTTSLLHVRYIRLYGPEPYALWLLSPPAASPLLPSPSPAVPDLQVGSCAGYPARSFACPAPANLREAETGASVASFSACAGNGGVCGTAAELPPQFRDLPITQAGSTWNITNNCSADQGAEDDTPGYDSSASPSLRKTARLDRGRTPRCTPTPVTSSPQHGSSLDE